MVCQDRNIFGWDTTIRKSGIYLNIEKIAFKDVKIKSLAMHITIQFFFFFIFTVGHLQNSFMKHDLYLIS